MRTRRLVAAALAGTLIGALLVAAPATAAGPPAPADLAAAANADGTVHFEWAPAPGASGYRLEWSEDSTFASGSVTTVDTYALDHITRWQPSADAGSDLYWRVTAFASALTVSTLGEPSTTGLVSVAEESAPTPLAPGSAFGPETIDYPAPTVFAWEPVQGAISYQLEYTSDTLGGGSGVVTQSVTGTQFAPLNPLARVDNGGNTLTWKWRVRAQFYNGTTSSTTNIVYGVWSPEREFQIVWDDAPTNLYPANEVTTVHSDLRFSWDAVAGAAKYRVSFGTALEPGDNSRILNPVTRDVYTTTFIPTSQASDTTYFWQVTPLDYAGNPGPSSPVHEYRKKWGTQDAPSLPADAGDVVPQAITGSLVEGSAPEVYLSDFELAWQPVPRATFYQVEVRDGSGSLWNCRTASTSATIIAYYASGLDNSGAGEVLKSSGVCLWKTSTSPSRAIAPGDTYSWRVRAVDFAGSSSTAFQSSGVADSLPSGVQKTGWSPSRYVTVVTDDRPAPEQIAVDLDLGAFDSNNPSSAAGQPSPLFTWERSGQPSGDTWTSAPGYEVILYKNPQRTAEIGRFRTPSTKLRIDGVFSDNTTANPYYASVRPIAPNPNLDSSTILVIGGIDNESVESFEWRKSANALTGLTTQTLSDGSVRLSWNPQSVTGLADGGSRGYQIRIFNGDVQQGITKKIEFPFFMAQKPASSTDTEFPSTMADVPLPPGNNYSFDVAPLDANGNPGPVSKSGAFSVGIAAPAVSEPAAVVGGSVSLAWDAVPGALKYSVQYRRVGAASFTSIVNVAQTATTINGLDQGNYEWNVRTHDASNQSVNVSAWSAQQTFSVGSEQASLDTPTGAVLSHNDRVLRWSGSQDGATRYQVQIADDAAFTQNVKAYETVGTALALPDLVTAAKQYYWRVKDLAEPVGASSALRVLATSEARTFTVRTVPAKVAGLTLTRSGGGLSAAWTLLTGANAGTAEPITYVVAYREKALDDDWSSAVVTETSASASSLLATTLTPGTIYQFRVAGKNSEGVGPWSDVKELSTASAPTAAPSLTATPKLASLALTFGLSSTANGNSPITGYVVRYKQDTADEWTEVQLGVVSTYTITGLINLTDYQVSVAAKNAIGVGPSAEVAARTLGLAGAPSTVKATRGDKAATVTWTAPAEPNGTVTGYVIQYRLGSTGTWVSAGTTSATVLKLTKLSLTNGKSYQFRVAAKTSLGTGTYSAVVSATPAGKPYAPTSVAAKAYTGKSTITWKKPSSNGSTITSFVIKYSTNNKTWYTLKTVSASTLKYTTTKGTKGKKIYFKVYAKNAVGTSAGSKTVYVTKR